MQRLFFHNRYDRASVELLTALPPDVLVVDVFGGGEVPGAFRISRLPYYVDKQIILETQSPYLAGTFTLEFACRDHLGSILTNENSRFVLEFDGGIYDIYPEAGLLRVEINCPIPKTIHLRLDGDGYWPWEGDIEVTASGA